MFFSSRPPAYKTEINYLTNQDVLCELLLCFTKSVYRKLICHMNNIKSDAGEARTILLRAWKHAWAARATQKEAKGRKIVTKQKQTLTTKLHACRIHDIFGRKRILTSSKQCFPLNQAKKKKLARSIGRSVARYEH